MNEITVSRLGCIVLSLFPALWAVQPVEQYGGFRRHRAQRGGSAARHAGYLSDAGVDVARDRRRLGLYVGVGCHHHAGNAGRPIRGRRRGADDRAI